MMTNLRLSVLATLALFLSGCLLVTPPPSRTGRSRGALSSSREPKRVERCRPSHYWDGDQCVHKGKGRGARKHDYR